MQNEVIIDGVNVAKCVRFTEEGHYCDLGGTCDGWDNCYFKQLQRAKAENQKLKQALEEIKNLLYTAENTTNGDLYFELVSKAYTKCNEVLDN